MCKIDLCGLKSNPTTYLPVHGWCITHCSEVSMLVYTVTYLYTSCTRIIYTDREKNEIAVTRGSCHRAILTQNIKSQMLVFVCWF